MSISPPILRYSYFKILPCKSLVNILGHIWPWKFKNHNHCQGQTWWSHLRSKVQLICLLFISWQSYHFGLRYSKLHIWSWTRQIWGIWKLRPAYSPETPNLGQNRWCFVPCHLEIWWMTLENNRAPLLCCFKLCATFHSHRWIQTGVAVR